MTTLADLEQRVATGSLADLERRAGLVAGPVEIEPSSPDPADIERAGSDARERFRFSAEMGLPLAQIEPLWDQLAPELDFHGFKRQPFDPTAYQPVDPTDPFAQAPPRDADTRIGLVEQITRMDLFDWASRLPFSLAPVIRAEDLRMSAQRLQADGYDKQAALMVRQLHPRYRSPEHIQAKADRLRAQDLKTVESYLLRQQETAERGLTFGARVFDGASYLPAWMIEFALTGGLARLGNKTAQEIGVRTLQGYAKTAGGRAALTAAGWTGGVITRTTLGMPHRIGEAILERQISTLSLADDGRSIEIDPERWATSIAKGYLHTLIEVGSESTGELMKPAAAALGRNTLGRLPFTHGLYEQMRRAYLALHPDATDFASRFFDAAKFDGLLAEMGEERVATILHAVVGTEDFGLGPDAGPLERLEAGMRQDLANLPVEAVTLLIPGAVQAGALAAQPSVDQRIKRLAQAMHQANDQVSVDEFTQRIKKFVRPEADPAEVAQKAAEELHRIDPDKTVEQWQAEIREATDEPADVAEKDPDAAVPAEGPAPVAAEQAPAETTDATSDESRVTSDEPRITLQQITEAVVNDNTEGLIADYELDQPDPAAVHREFRTWAWGRLPAALRRKLTALGEQGIESPLDAAEPTPENKERLAIEHAINQAYRLDESAQPSEASEAEVKEQIYEDAAAEAQQALDAFFSQPTAPDFTAVEPTRQQVRGLKKLMKRLGLAKVEGFPVIKHKDYVRLYKRFQLPDDIRRSFPQFDPIYQVQKARETQKAVLDLVFATKLRPYFDLSGRQLMEVDQLLVSGEQNRDDLKEILAKIDPKQHAAYKAVRESLDWAGELLVDKMTELGVRQEWIDEFKTRIGYYLPHKWYGNWRVVVKDRVTKKTVYMSGVGFTERQREADRLRSQYPDASISIVNAEKRPFDAYQDVTFIGLVEMGDKIVELANKRLGTAMTDEQQDTVRQAYRDIWKEKGFGMHFIHRQDVGGWTEDLRRPISEYFAGLSGYLSKMEAGLKFPEALSAVDADKTPNLYRVASEYIRDMMDDSAPWGWLKAIMYFKYLAFNVKSAAVNLSGNLMLGWPELSKLTKFSLGKLLASQYAMATSRLGADQKVFIEAYRKAGHSDANLSKEISAFGGNAVYAAALRGGKKAVTLFDIFQHVEAFNRESMAMALYDAKYAEGQADRLDKIAEKVEAAHFRYSKGNRQAMWRGGWAPLGTFRAYTANYLTWIKNQVKAKEWGALGRSLLVWAALGGVLANPVGALGAWLYRFIRGRDPQEDLEGAIGETAAEIIMRGVPSQAGVTLTGSVGMLDLLPETREGQDFRLSLVKWGLGAPGNLWDTTENVIHDLQTGQWGRALEDAAPEFLRNPLAAWRMSQGARTRGGAPLIDVNTREPLELTPREAALKALGFQPDRINRGYEQMRVAAGMQATRRAVLKHWAERFNLALLQQDKAAQGQILAEIDDYNRKIEARGQTDLRIEPKEMLSRVRGLQRPANLPTQRELETYLRLYDVPEEKE